MASGEIDLAKLISAPMEAAVKADFEVSRKFVEFIEQYGVEKGSGADGAPSRRLRTLSVDLPSDDGDPRWLVTPRRVEVPLLSMVPLPLLQLQSADFQFSLRIHDSSSEEKRSVKVLGRDEPDQEEDVKWRASFVASQGGGSKDASGSRSSASRTVDANMHAHIVVNQSELPAGISKLLTYMNESVRCSPERREKAVVFRIVFQDDSPPVAGRPAKLRLQAVYADGSRRGAGREFTLNWDDSAIVLSHVGARLRRNQGIAADDQDGMDLEIERSVAGKVSVSVILSDINNVIIGSDTIELEFA